MGQVLLTGGSGFLGSRTLLALVAAGHAVRTTVRSAARAARVRGLLERGGADPAAVECVVADLGADAGWADATRGCDAVLHMASPFPATLPKDPDALVGPAREGTLRVLRAARNASVRRVVVTSSFAAIGYGQPPRATPFDETCWTDPDAEGVQPYARSKTLAERAAWEFIAREGGGMELSAVNPVMVFGPVLDRDYSTSILVVQRLLDGAIPGCPRIGFGVVDVRDVADLHLLAMTHPAAAGERFLAVAGSFLSMHDIAMILRERLGPDAKRVPTRMLPDWLLRVAALFDPTVRQILPELGQHRNATADKARRLLGWSPRPPSDAIAATAASLLELGLVRGTPSARAAR